jgi:hypothetical protein
MDEPKFSDNAARVLQRICAERGQPLNDELVDRLAAFCDEEIGAESGGEPAARNTVTSEPWGPVETLAHRTAWRYRKSSDPHHSDTFTFNRACLLDFAEKLLAAERERMAKLCDELESMLPYGEGAACGDAIRRA